MFNKLFVTIIFIVVSTLYFTYNNEEYITDKMYLKNGIQSIGVISTNEISLLEKIDPFLMSGYLYSWSLKLSSNNWMQLADDLRWYSFINNTNQKDIILIRSSVYHTWRFDNICEIKLEWFKCMISYLLNIFNIIITIKPRDIKDIVVIREWQKDTLIGTWWSRIDQLLMWP